MCRSDIVRTIHIQNIKTQQKVIINVTNVPVAKSLLVAVLVVDGQILETVVVLHPADLGWIDNVDSVVDLDGNRSHF